ncbi:hypothetical protein JW916_11885 [Candidatus Sumerlaeota bacterium]|nr:hypothetical protein [Candidatus Sumerlaeota bacterium]
MLTQTYRSRCSYLLTAAALTGVLVLGGCAKQRANMALNSAQKRTEAAKSHDAQRFSQADLAAVEALMKEAQDNLAPGNYDQALLKAREAAERSKELLQTTKAKRATALKGESRTNVKVASDNLGSQISDELYTRITQNDAAAEQALSKTKYDKTIALCLEVAKDTEVLLQNLKDQADKDLRTTDNRLQVLLREGGQVEAPTAVSDVRAKIDEMRKLVEEERQYRKAKLVFAEIETLVEAGIDESRRSRAQKMIETIERSISRASSEEAEKYNSETFNDCLDQHKALLQAFYEQKYVDALQIAGLLQPKLDSLIVETRILASQARMDAVKTSIRLLEQDKVRQYLPGRLERMEALLARAQEAFDQELYDETKENCRIALDEGSAISNEFDELASTEIRASSGQIEQAEALLDGMAVIFESQKLATDDPLESRFEQGKQALRVTLATIANDARILLTRANVEREDKSFSSAIENAQRAARRAAFVVREVYHVVAHNNVLELGRRISETEKNGGAQFALKELQETKALLEEARAMIYQREKTDADDAETATGSEAYRPAVRKTSEAKAALESVIQRVTQAVVARVDVANKAIQKAEQNKANVYRPALGSLTTARQLASQASSSMKENQLFAAAQQADQAARFAMQANLQALQLWADDELKATGEQLKRAESAQADRYAAKTFKTSLDQFVTAQQLFQTALSQADSSGAADSFEKSKNLAIEARHNATGAREELLTTAKEKIVAAKRFEGWKYDYPLLMEAIINAKNAMEAMERGEYQVSRTFAEQASAQADQATLTSKEIKYRERLVEVSDDLQRVKKEGAAYYAPENIAQLMSRLGKVKADYSPVQFEAVASDLDTIENDLFDVAKSTPEIFNQLLQRERETYRKLADRGSADFAKAELDEANQLLLLAESDFKNGRYRPSYDEIYAARRALGVIELQYAEMDFVDEVRGMFAELDEEVETIQAFLDVSPAMMHKILEEPNSKRSANAVLLGADPVEFRQSMDAMYARSVDLAYPVTMEPEFRRLVEVFTLARQSGMAFERMAILDQYDNRTAKSIVDQAYDLIGRAMTAKTSLSSELDGKGLQGKLADYQTLIGN